METKTMHYDGPVIALSCTMIMVNFYGDFNFYACANLQLMI